MSIEEEFNLSEKRQDTNKGTNFIRYAYLEEDVKEFIKQEEFLITEVEAGIITFEEFWDRRKKLIGDKLK